MSASTHSDQVAELRSKIKSIRFAMFTTVNEQGRLVSRPMTNQETDSDGNLWFYTATDSELWEDIVARPEVNVSFAEPDDHVYVSVSGRAERIVDRAKIKAMWNGAVQAWYPHGPDDPHVVLVRVVSSSAEYWDSNAGKVVSLFEMAKAVLTGTTPEVDPGEHGRINL
ncbi:pyridoxamine 5'-phosphate oxidase family protein [Massilia antarctica]|uniref:pyridoxamine 5'-phosphate oxidase family protein n=1 Tax=Massilia antarctica TaxID=2765360 RepID=UPI0006BB86EE|nr:pyridoxamine 5'-phosphate oxidase family protein [Massilia sp. H27-R4]MCY0910143.1 pyridoxamine 5'-phosphate oxidase family protein [Massilia sp. H27-R4]CUI02764.1 General stress protein [Janthinobacterium sp. CG23_2]CUU26550.1 General stress protein [Janthinobacterium sp. CG23_2]